MYSQLHRGSWTEAQKTAMAESRCKIYYCSVEFFLEIIESWEHWDTMCLGTFSQSMMGSKAISVFYSEERRAFGFLLCHPDWDRVPDGELMPQIPNSDNHVFVKRRISEVFEIPDQEQSQTRQKCHWCEGSGNHPGLTDICPHCEGSGENQ